MTKQEKLCQPNNSFYHCFNHASIQLTFLKCKEMKTYCLTCNKTVHLKQKKSHLWSGCSREIKEVFFFVAINITVSSVCRNAAGFQFTAAIMF